MKPMIWQEKCCSYGDRALVATSLAGYANYIKALECCSTVQHSYSHVQLGVAGLMLCPYAT